jgi:WbqC-like protein
MRLDSNRGALTKRVAVMQPYLFPYGGYFRLFAAVDQFVVFDCVQFPRRGRVHRSQVTGPGGDREWLTLPLARQPRDVRICDLAFASDARDRFDRSLERYPWLQAAGPTGDRVRALLYGPMESVVDFVEGSMRLVAAMLRLEVPLVRSSTLDLDPTLRGESRVIAAAAAVGATHYVNAPGGRSLYDPRGFREAGLELSYLSPYTGQLFELLPALLSESSDVLRRDVLASTVLEPA